MKPGPIFPCLWTFSHKKVVVVGAGTIAKRRIRTGGFHRTSAVIAPRGQSGASGTAGPGKDPDPEKAVPEREDIYDADLVIATTNDHQTNEDIYSVCKCMGITVNVCSDKNKCDFYFPGIVKKDNLVVGITASGNNHKAARETSDRIRKLLNHPET